jgi:ketosteroid isomerase-like protein
MARKLFIFCILLSGCIHPATDKKMLEQELLKTDVEFSKMSVEKGMKPAFIYYAADSVIMLRQGDFPMIGKSALVKHLETVPDNKVQLSWTPVKVEADGDLGYTFGNWELRFTGKDTVEYGNYVTFWRKFPDGRWKYVLDGGNDTPKPKQH